MLTKWEIVLRPKNLVQFARIRSSYTKEEKCFSSLRGFRCDKAASNDRNYYYHTFLSRDNAHDRDNYRVLAKRNVQSITSFIRNCHVKAEENPADRFGTFGKDESRLREEIEMDENELREEEYHRNRPRRRHKVAALRDCLAQVREHIRNKDVNAAVDVLKTFGVQTSVYTYNHVIRELSQQGNMKQCFKLYTQMKKIGLTPNQATYNSLLNSCAQSSSPKAIEQLEKLRQTMYEKQILLNATHYNTMVKAYGRHGKTKEAFELVDEMCDKHLPLDQYTYSALLQAAISNKESGLRLALTTWHLMRYSRIKPERLHYNLLLRAMRDTKLGSLKINDYFVKGNDETKVEFSENKKPNLLQSPPIVSALLLPLLKGPPRKAQDIHTEIKTVNRNISNVASELCENIDTVSKGNNLILFGGLEYILKHMEDDNITPDAATMTLLLDLVPPSRAAEEKLLYYIEEKNLEMDVDFYNMLIKKRSMYKDYKGAKDVLHIMQRLRLKPNIMTFGVLALGCQSKQQAMELIDGIESVGFAPNKVILESMMSTACRSHNYDYLSYLLNYMALNKVPPSEKLISLLETLGKSVTDMQNPKTTKNGTINHKSMRKRRKELEHIFASYKKWKEVFTT